MNTSPPTPIRLLAVAFLVLLRMLVGAESPFSVLPSAPAGIVETGVPAFSVLSPESLGLSSRPLDFQLQPDGRILVVSQRELSFGDGLRWETFRQRGAGNQFIARMVQRAEDGTLYTSADGRPLRIHLPSDGVFELLPVETLPKEFAEAGNWPINLLTHNDCWYWYGSGMIIRWKPGEGPDLMPEQPSIDLLFGLNGRIFASDKAACRLYEVDFEARRLLDLPTPTLGLRDFVTCTARLSDQELLVGTAAGQLWRFNGQEFLPFETCRLLRGTNLISALCPLPDGHFAVAVENVGVVIIRGDGSLVGVLDRHVDSRLTRIRRLEFSPEGVLWMLLSDGIARMEYPSPFTDFSSMIPTNLSYVRILRHEGRLWILSEGRIFRGVYINGRLAEFTETPHPSRTLFHLGEIDGRLLSSDHEGIYEWRNEAWVKVLDGICNARLGIQPRQPEGWPYVARGEIGWFQVDDQGLQVRRLKTPELGDSYNQVCDAHGQLWLELGNSRLGRIRRSPEGVPQVQLFGHEHGLGDGWIQLYLLHGEAVCSFPRQVLRFDEHEGRFVPFTGSHPALSVYGGRPVQDSRGRFWLSRNGCVMTLGDSPDSIAREPRVMRTGFQPYDMVAEDSGVMWLLESRKLLRYDPTSPQPPERPFSARITSIQFSNTGAFLQNPGPRLGELPYENNAFSLRFAAPSTPFTTPITFEVVLASAASRLESRVSTGIQGTCNFNGLREGAYTVRVRPLRGELSGREAELSFVIRPPWFRSRTAYTAYALSLLLLTGAVITTLTQLEKREQRRLVHLVGERTAELQASQERYRSLNEELEKRVKERTAELESFSYSVSHDLRAPLRNIGGFAELLKLKAAGRLPPDGLRYVEVISAEVNRLGRLIDSLLAFSKAGRCELSTQACDLDRLVEAVRQELFAGLGDRKVQWRAAPLPLVQGDPTLLRQVLANLLGNALKFSSKRQVSEIEIDEAPSDKAGLHVIRIRDNGAGFDPRHADKLFGVFNRLHRMQDFEGTGIGLATVRRIIERHGGRVWAASIPDQGATFCFSLPSAVSAHLPPKTRPDA